MAGKPSMASESGAAYLKQNPRATAEEIARNCGLSVSAVSKSKWWKLREKVTK